MSDRIGVGDLEAALLKIVAVIQLGAAHKERAFWINNHTHLIRLHDDIAVGGPIHQIHLVLEPRAAASDHRHTQRPLGAALLGQDRAQSLARCIEHANQFFVSDAVLNTIHRRKNAHGPCECKHITEHIAEAGGLGFFTTSGRLFHMTTLEDRLGTAEKALQVNLDKGFYGTFAEIGAGQEVARHFFTAGGAAGTVAKTMSAYDMKFSDAIYGPSPRYVSRERLQTMLEHERALLVERLGPTAGRERRFFVFADTVAARSFRRHDESHGWMGLRFQHAPDVDFSDIILHVRMLDPENLLQQEALGIVGVNLIHAAFCGRLPKDVIGSLLDNLKPGRIEVDMIRFSGPAFGAVDNRLMSLELVVQGLTSATLFRANGEVIQAADAFYKKPILVERGSFRPVTLVTNDMLDGALRLFEKEQGVEGHQSEILMEITIKNLLSDGVLDLQDFLDRVDMLSALGRTVLISDYGEYYRLVNYLTRYTEEPIGLPMGIPGLHEILKPIHYGNLEGGILEAVGRLFKKNVRLYVYPCLNAKGELVNCENYRAPKGLEHLYEYLRGNGFIRSIDDYNTKNLHIRAPRVLEMISAQDRAWESMVPPEVVAIIKERRLFGAGAR